MKQRYYTGDRILKEKAQYNLIYGERSNGKSYWIKEYCVSNAYHNDNKFVLLRRYQIEVKASDVESYFADTPIKSITKGEYNTISVYRGSIYLANIIDDKVVRGKLIGRCLYLSGASHYKSQAFPDYTDIIFEEVLAKSGYLPNEPSELMELVSTIARRREIRVWMIGNTISRVCPYYSDWGLVNIPRQEQGTIDVYNFKTSQKTESGQDVIVKIAVEYCANSGNNSKMFFGRKEKSITGGSWECREYPNISTVKDYEVAYEILLKRCNFNFVIQLCTDTINGGVFLYVYPLTTRRKIDRIISDDFSTNPLETDCLLPSESIIRDCINNNRVCYSDNLTGEDFTTILKLKEI